MIPKGIIFREYADDQRQPGGHLRGGTAGGLRDGRAVGYRGLRRPLHRRVRAWRFRNWRTPIAARVGVETTVRVKYGGEYETMVYDFDPCRDVVGWVGDPVVGKLNVWDIPGLGSSHGFMPPPTGAVFMARDKSFFFNVLSVKPFPNEPAPNGSYGAPGHQNDYEEVWFNHASENAPETDGPHVADANVVSASGAQAPARIPRESGAQDPRAEAELRHHVDPEVDRRGQSRLLMPDPQAAIYTSFYGAHIGIVPRTRPSTSRIRLFRSPAHRESERWTQPTVAELTALGAAAGVGPVPAERGSPGSGSPDHIETGVTR